MCERNDSVNTPDGGLLQNTTSGEASVLLPFHQRLHTDVGLPWKRQRIKRLRHSKHCPIATPHPLPQSHSEQPQAVQSTLGRVTYSKGLAARRQHRSPKWPLNPIRTALKEKKKHETEWLKAKICLNELYSSSLPQVLLDIKSKMKKNTASPGYVMGGFIAKHCTLW